MSLQPGDVIADRYELGRQLGAGGMARVYLAHDRLLDREVAVKVLSDPYASDPQFVERFRREASAAAGLNHPNIVAVYDRGQVDGAYYIVMEYLPGPDLKQVIRRRGPLPPGEAIDNALQILSALGAAHRRDVIHRDVKPQNVMVSEEGHLKVTDFGIARAGAQSEMTEAGSVIGTAQYLSPEQARGDEVTAASDCYAVGIVLYEMLTGTVPFDAERPVAVAMKQITDPPMPPRELVPTIPPVLEAVVLHSLAKRPSERFRTAEEFSRALLDARGEIEGTTGSTRVMPGVAAMPTEATSVMGQPTATTRVQRSRNGAPPPSEDPPRRRRRWPWVVAAIVVLIAIAGVAYAVMSGGDDAPMVTVPDVTSQPVARAEKALKDLKFAVTTRTQVDANTAQGRVIRTTPPAGTQAPEGSTVTLVVSGGPGKGTVPNVVGESETAAVAAVVQAGFEADVNHVADPDVPEGEVISQDPAGNTQADKGDTVTLQISTGPEAVDVPDVRGMTEDAARRALVGVGLELGSVTTQTSDTTDPGLVISQNPGQGTSADPGTAVSVVLAAEPDTIAVPNVIGNGATDAAAKLGQLGFVVTSETATSNQPAGDVIDQRPSGGTEVQRGARVIITVSDGPAEPTQPAEPTTPPTTATPPVEPPTGTPTTGGAVPPPELP